MKAQIAALFALALSTTAAAQTIPPPTRTVTLSGPRFGVSLLVQGIVDTLKDRDIEVKRTITQFGWQFEKQFYTKENGLTAVNEWVMLVGGLDQGVALPSVSWLVGLRTSAGSEFGVGPNVTPAGVALAVAGGTTFRAGALNVPMNIVVVPSRAGMRVSFLTGFTMRR